MKNFSSKFRLSPCQLSDFSSSSSSGLKHELDFDRPAQLFSEKTAYLKPHPGRQTGKLDLSSFGKAKKSTVSGSLCLDCVAYKETIEELRQEVQNLSQNWLVSEKNLKHYDQLLQIKDNRLKQQEDSLGRDLESFDREKELLYWERKKLEEEKLSFESEKNLLECETRRVEKALLEISKKNRELQDLYEELEARKAEFLDKNFSIESENRKSLIISRESDIQRLVEELSSFKNESSLLTNESSLEFQKYLKRKHKNKQLKIELKKLAGEVQELRKIIENQPKHDFEAFETRRVLLTETEARLFREKNSIEEMKKHVNEEAETIDQLKSALLMEKAALEQEKKNLLKDAEKTKTIVRGTAECRSCTELKKRLGGLQEILAKSECDIRCYEKQCQELQSTTEVLESKLKIIECSREATESENSDLKQLLEEAKTKKKNCKARMQELEKIINIGGEDARVELEKLKTELESGKKNKTELEKQNQRLCQKLQILSLRFEELERCGIDGKKEGEGTWDLYSELQCKVEEIRAKENEISEMKGKVLEERNVIEAAAESLKSIHEDLMAQKKAVEAERENNEILRNKILELDRKQEDKGKMLSSKEKELNCYKEQLIERENLLLVKEKRGV